jgi:hypothetical protein
MKSKLKYNVHRAKLIYLTNKVSKYIDITSKRKMEYTKQEHKELMLLYSKIRTLLKKIRDEVN